MSKFLTPLRTEAMVGSDGMPLTNRDGRRLFMLLDDLQYQSKIGGLFTVEAGYVTDFGSVPRIPVVFDVLGEIAYEPYVIHDMLYSKKKVSRDEADQVLREALICMGVSEWKASLIFDGVRAGGESHYGTS